MLLDCLKTFLVQVTKYFNLAVYVFTQPNVHLLGEGHYYHDTKQIQAMGKVGNYDSQMYKVPTLTEDPNLPNLIFVAVDDLLQTHIVEQIRKSPFYSAAINSYTWLRPQFKPFNPLLSSHSWRLESLAWYMSSSSFQNVYDQVLLIPYDKFDINSLLEAVAYMERQGKAYHIVLLTHGTSACISASESFSNIFSEDLEGLKEWNLSNLELVFLQSCWSVPMGRTWKSLGAKSVIAFDTLNNNFFYYFAFLSYQKKLNANISTIFNRLNDELKGSLANSPLLPVLEAMSQDLYKKPISEFMAEISMPKLIE